MKQKNTGDSGRRGRLGNVLLILIFIVGIGILLYPSVSDWWNKRASSRAIFSYEEAVSGLTQKDYSGLFAKAEAWNERLADVGTEAFLLPEKTTDDYWEILDVTGTGIMGYVTIDKINISLPIYHGTSDSVLSSGAGHIEWSSFPIGGAGTHSVISAHRGLPSARLFTDLDRLEAGDTFTITVLDQILTYEVDQILIVLPNELQNLYIEKGQDYCTLLTCTPYGINTHRILVRGRRTENGETGGRSVRVKSDAIQIEPIMVAPLIAAPILLILLIVLLLTSRKK